MALRSAKPGMFNAQTRQQTQTAVSRFSATALIPYMPLASHSRKSYEKRLVTPHKWPKSNLISVDSCQCPGPAMNGVCNHGNLVPHPCTCHTERLSRKPIILINKLYLPCLNLKKKSGVLRGDILKQI